MGYYITKLPRNSIIEKKVYHNTEDKKVIKDIFSAPKSDNSGFIRIITNCIEDLISYVFPKRGSNYVPHNITHIGIAKK